MDYDDLRAMPLLTAEQEQNAGTEDLVRHNFRLVAHIANQWKDRGVDEEDLIQEGMLGLLTAANRFDSTRGVRFSTFATQWITHHVRRAIQKSGVVRNPIHVQQEGTCEVDPSFVSSGEDEGEYNPADKGPSPSEQAELNDWRRLLQERMERLSPRETEVLVAFYGMDGAKPKTGTQIAEEQGVTRGMISRIRRRAEEKLRKG